jgi:hypothetical protein
MAGEEEVKLHRANVAEYPLPQAEGSITVSVTTEEAQGVWDEIRVTKPMYYHKGKRNGCGGPMRIVHVNDEKTVLCCTGCLLRMELRGEDGARPARISGLKDVLAHMVKVEEQI